MTRTGCRPPADDRPRADVDARASTWPTRAPAAPAGVSGDDDDRGRRRHRRGLRPARHRRRSRWATRPTTARAVRASTRSTVTRATTTSSGAPTRRRPPSPSSRPDSPTRGDTLAGDAGEDVVLGDNGAVTRPASTGLSTTLLAAPLGQPADGQPRRGAALDHAVRPRGHPGSHGLRSGHDHRRRRQRRAARPGRQRPGRRRHRCRLRRGRPGLRPRARRRRTTTTSRAARPRPSPTGAGGATGQPDGADNVYGGTRLRPRDRRQRPADPGHVRPRLAHDPCQRDPGRDGPGTRSGALRPQQRGCRSDDHRRTRRADSLSGQEGVDVLLGQDGDRPDQRWRRRRLRRGRGRCRRHPR